MRILHVSKKYPPALGGDGFVVEALRREQEASGHHVVVVTSRTHGVARAGVVPVGCADEAAALDRISPRRLASLAVLTARFGRILDTHGTDVVHTHSLDMGLAASAAARRRHIPTVHTCHIVEADRPDGPAMKRTLERVFLTGSRHRRVVAFTEGGAELLRSAGVRGVVTIPHGVNVSTARPRPAWEGPLRFVAVGRLEDQKGFDVLVEAFAEVEAARPGRSSLQIVGSGSREERLRRAARDLAVCVDFAGLVGADDMADVYAAADVYVMSSRCETGPLTFYEAWGAGLAAVSTKVGAPSEIGVDGVDVLLVEAGDAGGLAAAMVRLIDDRALVAELGAAGARRTRGLPQWADIAGRYEGLYLDAMTSVRGGAGKI